MKCKHCGSQWNSTASVTVCPFCQKPLMTPQNGSKTMISVLVQIRDQLGVQVMGNGKALISGFKDIAPELKKEYNMLTHLEKCGGIRILYATKEKTVSEQQLAISKLAHIMADEYALQESAAHSVCRDYMLVLTGKEKEAQNPNRETNLAGARQKPTPQQGERVSIQTQEAVKPVEPTEPPKSTLPPSVQSIVDKAVADTLADIHKKNKNIVSKPLVTPTNSSVTPRQSTAAPKISSNTNKSTKTSNLHDKILTNMWIWIVCAVALFLAVFSYMDYPEELYGVIPLFAVIFWMGRALLKKGSKILGGICIFNASVWATLFTGALPMETWLAVALQIIMVLLLTYSGIKHKK